MKELFLKEGFDSIHTSISFDEDENVQESIYLVESDHVCYKFKSRGYKRTFGCYTRHFLDFNLKKLSQELLKQLTK